ncbi:MAG: hypothetical protein QW213_07525 [Thermoproteota archaeon]
MIKEKVSNKSKIFSGNYLNNINTYGVFWINDYYDESIKKSKYEENLIFRQKG